MTPFFFAFLSTALLLYYLSPVQELVQQASSWLREHLSVFPHIAVVTGSGLSPLSSILENPSCVPYSNIPNFPCPSGVPGHPGELRIGTCGNKGVAFFCGRLHYYEGYLYEQLSFSVRLLAEWGARILVLTNAAGGLSSLLSVGDLMLLRDHLNFMFRNSLIGPEPCGTRFPDMSSPYDPQLRQLAREVAAEVGFCLPEGVYVGVLGPNYETRAEVLMFQSLGADAVGMSTVPEVLTARRLGLKVLAFSLISNSLVRRGVKTTHQEVLETTSRALPRFSQLLREIIARISR